MRLSKHGNFSSFQGILDKEYLVTFGFHALLFRTHVKSIGMTQVIFLTQNGFGETDLLKYDVFSVGFCLYIIIIISIQ